MCDSCFIPTWQSRSFISIIQGIVTYKASTSLGLQEERQMGKGSQYSNIDMLAIGIEAVGDM